MDIYFAGSIRGGRDDQELYLQIIQHLKQYGSVLSEHIGKVTLNEMGEAELSDKEIHDRDLEWIIASQVIVGEVTQASLGVGYELAKGTDMKKPILCLYRPQKCNKVSAMIAGSSSITLKAYDTIEDAKKIIDDYMKELINNKLSDFLYKMI